MLTPQNLTLAGSVSQVTFALTLSLLAWSDRRSKGTRWLAAACVLQLFATVVRRVGGSLQLTTAPGWQTSLLVVVFYLIYLGMRWFVNRRPLVTRVGPFFVFGSFILIFAVAYWSEAVSAVLGRLGAMVIMSLTIRELVRVRFAELRHTAWFVAALMVASIGVFGFRLVLDSGWTPGDSAFLLQIARNVTMVTFTLLAFSSVAMFSAESKRRLNEESRQDALTGLGNRRAFEEAIRKEMSSAQRSGRPLTLLMIDLDHFKRLNDTHGHDVGDRALRATGGVFQAAIASRDTCARIGGEEFAILLPGRDLDQAVFFAEQLRQNLQDVRLRVSNGAAGLTASIGVSQMIFGEDSWETLLQRADRALYQAKREGRNRVLRWSMVRDGMPSMAQEQENGSGQGEEQHRLAASL